MQAAKVSFLGLGRMGSAIARRMLAAGIPLSVWNRSATDTMDALVAAGAAHSRSAADALAAPVSFSMLADDSAADAVLSRANIGEARTGRIHVNCASVSAEIADLLAHRFADAGIAYVSAPVLGRPEVAEAGKLNVLVAGPTPAIDAIEPIVAAFSARIWRLGEQPRQANAVKIALNFMLLHALESMSEGFALVEAEGIESGSFVDLFTSTFFGGMVYSVYGSMMAERRYTPPGFTVALGLKDLGLAERLAAHSKVEIPAADVLRYRFEAALADPAIAESDWSAIAELARRSGRSV